jgi:hypothetical protein
LNNREIATLIWILLVIIACLFSSKLRNAIRTLLKVFFVRQIVAVVLISITYTFGILLLLAKIGLWDLTLVKDATVWFIGSGFVIVMNLNEVKKEKAFFKKLLIDNFKLIVILEFITNFHVFTLPIELIIIPCLVFLAMLSAVAGLKAEHKNVKNLVDGVLTIIGLTFLIFSVIDISGHITSFASFTTLKAFALPIILTIAFLPCAYLIALYMNYEELFVRLNFYLKNNPHLNYAKGRLVMKCNVSLSRLFIMSPRINELYIGATKDFIKKVIS